MIVEAVAPLFDRETSRQQAAHTALLKIIDHHLPEDRSAFLRSLPVYRPGDSKRDFKEALRVAAHEAPGQRDHRHARDSRTRRRAS